MEHTCHSRRIAFAIFLAALLPLTTSPTVVQAKNQQRAKTAPTVAAQPFHSVMVGGAKVPLPDGTHVKLQLTETISSNKSKTGDQVHYVVDEDVVGAGKKVLIRKGAPAVGTITRAKARGGLGRSGKLDFTCESVTAADGRKIPLRGEESAVGKSGKGSMLAVVILVSPLGLFMKGHNIIVKQGTIFTAYVNSAQALAAAPAARK